jgi:hypothetical protein
VVVSLSGVHFTFLFLVPVHVDVKWSQEASSQKVKAMLLCRKGRVKMLLTFPAMQTESDET